MRIPQNYPNELSRHLSTIAEIGYVPTKKNVKCLEIIKDLSDCLGVNLNEMSNTLFCCSADLNLRSKFPNLTILTEVDAENVSRRAADMNVAHFEKIIIFSDWISGARNLHLEFRFLNSHIQLGQSFYLVEQKHYRSDKLIEICNGGNIHKWFFYKKWKKTNSSHMHLGYNKIEKPNLTMINLTPDY